jgi:hypothetical protein
MVSYRGKYRDRDTGMQRNTNQGNNNSISAATRAIKRREKIYLHISVLNNIDTKTVNYLAENES